MKTLVFSLILCLACSCGQPIQNQIWISDDQPDWVHEAAQTSVDFWAGHDVQIQVSTDGVPVLIQDIPDDEEPGEVLGSYSWDLIGTRIRLSPALDLYYSAPWHAFALTHEIGHMIGLEHLEDEGSLMQPILSGCEDPAQSGQMTTCWSEADQAALDELDRAWEE